jgi:XTP/dITP diphosphohydrolase
MAARQFTGDTLVIATHNPGKVPEILALLPPQIVKALNSAELNLPEPVETETSFIGNAILKARDAAQRSTLPALADDSGLCVDALDGQPGYLSARWAGKEKNFAAAMQRVLDGLQDKPDRSASFRCALALAWPDGHVECVEGKVDGTIAPSPRGTKGFGYDAIFIPAGHSETFAENPALKDEISHRAAAFRLLVAHCFASGRD